MSNKNLFKSAGPPPADTKNSAGGLAYNMSPKHALAQFAATGCLNDTYYTKAEAQLAAVLDLASKCTPEYVAKVALWSREKGAMKDMPALLTAHLAAQRGPGGQMVAKALFPRTIDNGRQLRNFVQMIRSGALGKKSLGTAPKKMVQSWFASRTPDQIFRNSIGDQPSMADVIKLAHPAPGNDERRALHGYLLGKEHNAEYLPSLIKQYESFKKSGAGEMPRVPFEMLVGLPLNEDGWRALAMQASWTQLRMNLNTFNRHGVFKDAGATRALADKLRNPDLIRAAKPMPYQLLMAYMAATDVPTWIRNALQDAMEVAVENVPALDGGVLVCPDHSGSMDSPVTGQRGSATSQMTCKLVAALISSVFLRRNQEAGVLPFASQVTISTRLNPRDSIMTNAQILGRLPSGGTNCAAPLEYANRTGVRAKTVIMVSDNESWIDSPKHNYYNYWSNQTSATAYQKAWDAYKRRVSGAKLVCIDLAPNSTVQAKDSATVMNVGGFSDSVFDTVARFVNGTMPADHWVGLIEAQSLSAD